MRTEEISHGGQTIGGIGKTSLSPDQVMMITNQESRTPGELPLLPDVLSMKERRKQNTAVVGIVCGLTGLLIGGPIVGVVAGFTCAVIAKKKWKKQEKKAADNFYREVAGLLSPPPLNTTA
jgi:hypothetical protein